MDRCSEEMRDGSCVSSRRRIARMLEQIENPEVLIKIYTVVKTHLEILRQTERS